MIIWVIILFFLSIVCIILWTPLRLFIDTKRDIYKIEWVYIGSASVISRNDDFSIQIQILFFTKIISFESLFKGKRPSSTAKRVTPANQRKVSKPTRLFSKLKKILFSFEIKTCKINWDTDDFLLNAYLYPITPFLFTPKKSFAINFEGKREVELIIENRLGRIIKSFF